MTPALCPCQSGDSYSECCQPLHAGAPASSPEALMRSRFSAFALGNADYVKNSWHRSTRPANLSLDEGERWMGLTVIEATQNGDQGSVHFKAVSRDSEGFSVLEETSRFVQENGYWFYVDGIPHVFPLKPGRNDPCPCGSGKKFKKCCS